MTDYSNLVYIHDREGNEYACPATLLKGNIRKAVDLTETERKRCVDMSTVIDQFWG